MGLTPVTIHIDLLDGTLTAIHSVQDETSGRTGRLETVADINGDPLLRDAISQLAQLVTSDAAATVKGAVPA